MQKIENSLGSSNKPSSTNTNILSSKSVNKIETDTNNNNIKEVTNSEDLKDDSDNLFNIMKDMQQLYSSINTEQEQNKKSEVIIKKIEKVKNTETSTDQEGTSLQSKEEEENEEDDNSSLKSLSDVGAKMKFSPVYDAININTPLQRQQSTKSIYSAYSNSNKFDKKESFMSINSFYSNNSQSLVEDLITNKDNVSHLEIYNPYDLELDEHSSITNKKKLFTPMFYNPLKQPIESEQENKISNNNNINENNNQELLRIWKGDLSSNKMNLQVSLIAKNESNNLFEFDKLNAFPEVLDMNSKAKTKEVIPYIEKNIASKARTILFGWLEIDDINQSVKLKKINYFLFLGQLSKISRAL